jgi:hypothetical protein
MRRIFFSSAKLIFFIAGITFYSQAQIARTIPGSTEPEGMVKNVKLYRNQVSSKAIRDFMKRYKDVSNEKWTVTNAGITASFAIGEISHSVCYDEKGNWVFTVRRYLEKYLPKQIRRRFRNAYFDYNIKGVEETEKSFNLKVYLVLLENEAGWIKVRVEDGELSQVEKIKK